MAALTVQLLLLLQFLLLVAFQAARDQQDDQQQQREADAERPAAAHHDRVLVRRQTPRLGPARLWTLSAYDGAGRLMANPAERFAYDSRAILRRPDGTFVIAVAPRVPPGNWLPVAEATRFTLVLRLYGTPLTSTARPVGIAMPAIRRTACP